MIFRYSLVLPFSIIFGLSSCTFLPSSGPSSYKIRHEAGNSHGNYGAYELVKIDEQTINLLSNENPVSPCMDLSSRVSDSDLFIQSGVESLGAAQSQTILAGDLLNVVIFEAGGGLYSPIQADSAGGTPATILPPQRMDMKGEINIPYAGSVKAVGRLISELENDIKQLLTGKTINPQVIVNISNREGGNLITVGGDVKSPCVVPVPLAGTRLIDAITLAGGGSKLRPYETLVAVTRKNKTRFDTLKSVFDKPEKNIYLQPGDTVLVREVPLTCMIFGASGIVTSMPIDVEDLSLSRVMAKSGGGNDMRASVTGVFIYRKENRDFLSKLGRRELPENKNLIPVIYQIEMNKPQAFFLASDFKIRDGDIIYYSNAGLIGLTKFTSLIQGIVGPFTGTASNLFQTTQMATGAIVP